ncbi:hypothetical protein Taro_030226, partial [Colocasia esculenta]|nr:hypothetical protein [Colocasia esculenta]
MEELRLFVQIVWFMLSVACGLGHQRQREAEAESTVNFQELREELASRDALQRKLETRIEGIQSYYVIRGIFSEVHLHDHLQIKCLENDNVLLEKKQKELRFTLDDVLKSRDTFVNIYKDSTCVLKNAIEVRDRKLSILSDKIQRHLSLFDFIEKEAEAVKQTVDSVQELDLHLELLNMELMLQKIQDTTVKCTEAGPRSGDPERLGPGHLVSCGPLLGVGGESGVGLAPPLWAGEQMNGPYQVDPVFPST